MSLSTELTLYRGLSVPTVDLEDVVGRISERGIQGDEGTWTLVTSNLRSSLDVLIGKPDLTREDTTQRSFRVICACGDEMGATYYAQRGSQPDKSGLVVEMRVSLADVFIDGRDFLCAAFQLWDRSIETQRTDQARFLEVVFGPAIRRYFDRACATKDQEVRIALCDLACSDPQVVLAHAQNWVLLEGRYGTRFRSAFFVRPPIEPGRICSVRRTDRVVPIPFMNLNSFLEGALSRFLSDIARYKLITEQLDAQW